MDERKLQAFEDYANGLVDKSYKAVDDGDDVTHREAERELEGALNALTLLGIDFGITDYGYITFTFDGDINDL